ncbi:MAG: hypothetical protein Q8K79_20215 [Solirubrobacteraceae bacterium]|nr:hypothetical protein [Solirubrobacteraceae bacterium]
MERHAAPGDGTAPPLSPPGELSAWQQLLAEVNRLMRDPTLTRALKAFAAKVTAGLRGVPGFLAGLARSAARALARIRLPRRLLLGLLALLLPLALLALLTSSDDERAARSAPASPSPPAEAAAGLTLPAVGMPQVLAQPDEVRPVRVALVLDRTYDGPALRRELAALSGWLTENHAPGTRVAVIDAAGRRASAPLSAERLTAAAVTRERASTASAIRAALARRNGRGLVVSLGTEATAPGAARSLRIATRPGAATGSGAGLARRKQARVTIDERRPNALAASVARAIMAISGERERR